MGIYDSEIVNDMVAANDMLENTIIDIRHNTSIDAHYLKQALEELQKIKDFVVEIEYLLTR